MPLTCVFTSVLTRAQHTLKIMLEELGQTGLPETRDQALNERDYGELTGLNKDDARKKWGEEQVLIWRRSYDVPPPGGESLKDTLARALPYYMIHIQPLVLSGKRVLVSAHGNSLRALIMAIEGLTPEQILKRELETGVPVCYRIGADSRPISVGNTVCMIIRELTSSDYDAAVPRLAEMLVDAVDSGAGVTFMHPLPQDVAEAYWMKQKADVASGQTNSLRRR